MEVKDQQFENLCNNALELRNQIKERIERKERKRKMKKQTGPIQCKGYLGELMAKLADVSSSLSQLYQDPRDVSSADDYMRFSNYLRDGLQYTLEQITKFLEGSSKNFESSQLSVFITKLHHVTDEIKMLFPEGKLNPSAYCVKPDVEKWWKENFSQSVIVPRDEFYKAFLAKHVRFQKDNKDLFETMSFTSEFYVSKYALDLFTRLFSPWEKCYNVHKALIKHPAYVKHATSSLIAEKLKELKDKPGSFYFRISVNNPGIWAIGYITAQKSISHVLCYGLPIIDTLYQQRNDLYRFPDGNNQDYDLSKDLELGKQIFIKPDPNGDPLMCTLCGNNRINTQFDQCEHICCHNCSRAVMSQAIKKREPMCPMCQRPVLSTSYINLSVGELYSDVDSQPAPWAASPSPQVKQPSPAVNQFAGYGPRNSPNMKPDKASERANKLRLLAEVTGKHETVLQTAVSWLVNQGYDEGNVFDALLESNGDRDKAAKILESGKLQRKASAPSFLHPNANTFGNSDFPVVRSNSDIGNDGSHLRPPSQVFNGVPLDPSTGGGYSIPKEGSYQKRSPNLRPHPNLNPFGNFDPSAWKERHSNRPSGSPQRPQSKMFNGVPLDPRDKASERANKLRALAAQTGKHESFLQTAVSYLANMGYDEDSVYNALMKSNGDRDKAQKDLECRGEQRKNSEPAFPKIPDSLPRKVSVPIPPNKSPMNPRYGPRNSPNIRTDKATERAQKLRDLSARTSKHENVLQTAVSFLVTQGYDEEKVFQALMESDGDRDKAARILAGSSA